MTTLCIGTTLQTKQEPSLLHQSLPSITKVFSGLEMPVVPDVSPGGSSVSSDRATPLTEDGFEYCDDCKNHLANVDIYSSHVMVHHLKPKRLPSAQYFECIDKSDDLLKRPYTTLYPSKKRKPDSERIPRPQNQYMIFSNYIRTPLMKYFGDINHAQISQAISTVWKRLTDTEKQAFKDESKQCELLHKIEYPHYKYKPKQKKTKKTDTNLKEDMSPQTSEELSPVENKYFDSVPTNNLYVNVSEPPVQPPTSTFLSNEKFSQLSAYGQYSPVGESHAFTQAVSDAPSFQPYASPQTSMMTSLGEGTVLHSAKSVPMFVKRDPVLSQNSAPQLSNEVTLSSSWTPGMTVVDQFTSADNPPHFIVLQNGVPGSLNNHLLTTDVVPHHQELQLPCSAPTDLTASITDSNLLNDLKMMGYNAIANNQPMDIDHPRDHLSAFDAASLPNYDIDDKKDILDNRDGFEDYLQQYDEPMYLNPCAM